MIKTSCNFKLNFANNYFIKQNIIFTHKKNQIN